MAGIIYKSLKAAEHMIAHTESEYSIAETDFDQKTKKLVIRFKKDIPLNLKTTTFEAGQIINEVKRYLTEYREVNIIVTHATKQIGTIYYKEHFTILLKYLSKLQNLVTHMFDELNYMIQKVDKNYVEDVILLYLGAKQIVRSTIGIEFTTYENLLTEAINQVEQNFKEILEIDENTDVDHLPIQHFEKLITKHGYDTVIKALYEYALWCKIHRPEYYETVNSIIIKLEEIYNKHDETGDFIKDESAIILDVRNYILQLVDKFYTTKSYAQKIRILNTLEDLSYYDLTKKEYIEIAAKFALPDYEIMLEAEQADTQEEEQSENKAEVPKIPVETQIDKDILALAIIATQSELTSIKNLAFYALNKLGIREWLKEVNDKTIAIKKLNSLLTVSTKFKIARLYTKDAVNKLMTTAGNVTKKPTIKDTDVLELGQKIGAILAYDAIR